MTKDAASRATGSTATRPQPEWIAAIRKWKRPAAIMFAVALTTSACGNDQDQPTTVGGGAGSLAPQVAVATPTTFVATPTTQPAPPPATPPASQAGNIPPVQPTHQM
jgi:hypothetical protein